MKALLYIALLFTAQTSLSQITITGTLQDLSCNTSNGIADGSIQINVTGGVPPYTYDWSSGDVGTFITGLAGGSYQVSVTDADGNLETQIFDINEPLPINITLTRTGSVCHPNNGDLTGSIDITVTGGTSPYTYDWAGPGVILSNEDQDGLGEGTYFVTVTDSNGCTNEQETWIGEPLELVFDTEVQNIECENGAALFGEIDLNVFGGIWPYTYEWSNGLITEDPYLGELEAGSYAVTVTDSEGCTTSGTFDITGTAALIVIATSTGVQCSETGNPILGSIELEVEGGQPPYQFVWSDNANDMTAQNQENLTEGIYSVTVVDSGECADIAVEVVISGESLNLRAPTLCLVTNDNLDGFFEVYWQDADDITGISEYRIYREGSMANQFDMIGKVSLEEDNKFIDMDANANQQAYRYYVTAANLCGDESVRSEIHKTIHLTINQGTQSNINLIWDEYEGVTYDQVTIFRGDSPSTLEEYAVLAGNVFSFTDVEALGIDAYYQIVITASIDCVITRESFLLKSNVSRIEVNSIKEVSWIENVYPNPFTDQITIELESAATIEVIDVNGKLIKQTSLVDGNNVITTNDWPSGIYMIRMVSGGEIATWRGVKD